MTGPPDLRGLCPSSRPDRTLEDVAADLTRRELEDDAPPVEGLTRGSRLRPVTADKEKREARHALQFGPQSRMCRLSPCCIPNCRRLPPQDPHHVTTRGAGGKDKDTVPLCETRGGSEGHHEELHRTGMETFQRRHRVNLAAIAKAYAKAVAAHDCSEWAFMDHESGAVSCAVCERPVDQEVTP